MQEKKRQVNNKKRNITIGILGITLGISLLISTYIDKKIDYAYTYMNNQIFAFNETKDEPIRKPKVEQAEVETVEEENIDPTPSDSDYNYVGTLEIPKVGLKKGFLDMNSTDNDVDRNIRKKILELDEACKELIILM